jgi:D-alanyl-D-alanine carboxypeptidase
MKSKTMKQQKIVLNKWQTIMMSGASWMRYVIVAALMAFLVMGATSCSKQKLEENQASADNLGIIGSGEPEKEFDPVRFRNSVNNSLMFGGNTRARGYSLVITKNGQVLDTASSGWAYRYSGNNGYAPMHVKQEMQVASVTKTITAVAIIQLLKKNNLSINSKISSYVPAYWNAKQAIKDLTFRELMTHSSGLTESSHSWDSIRATVARGLDNPAKPAGVYANINFSIFRAIIPYLIDKEEAVSRDNSLGNAAFESWLSAQYIQYVQQNIFTPIGMSNVGCTPSATTAMGFNECATNAGVCGVVTMTPTDQSNAAGGAGYFMSAWELARFMVYLRHTNNILDATQRSMMDNNLLGWDANDSWMTERGPSYGKGGAWFNDSNNSGNNDAGDAGMQSMVIKYPGNIEVVLFVNSIPGAWRSLSPMMRSAYNSAWVTVE